MVFFVFCFVFSANATALVLMPLLQYFNHANPPHANTRWVHLPADASKGELTGSLGIIALADIAAGDELTVSYSAYSALPLEGNDAAADPPATKFVPIDNYYPQRGLSNTQLLLHYGIALPFNGNKLYSLCIFQSAPNILVWFCYCRV
jgi:hypothetical protein